MQDDGNLPSLNSLQAEQRRFMDEQQLLYDERPILKKETRRIDTIKAKEANYLSPSASKAHENRRNSEHEYAKSLCA